MNPQPSQPSLFFPWVLASTSSSLFASLFIFFARSSLAGRELPWLFDLPDQLASAIVVAGLACGLLVLGMLVAIPQSITIQLLHISARRWILATSLGFVVGLLAFGALLNVLFLPPLPERMNATYWFLEKLLPLTGLGLGVGGSQWILIRTHIRRSSTWILAHAIAFPFGYITAIVLPSSLIRASTSGDSMAFLRLRSAYNSSLFSDLFPVFLAGMIATLLTALLLQTSRSRGYVKGAA